MGALVLLLFVCLTYGSFVGQYVGAGWWVSLPLAVGVFVLFSTTVTLSMRYLPLRVAVISACYLGLLGTLLFQVTGSDPDGAIRTHAVPAGAALSLWGITMAVVIYPFLPTPTKLFQIGHLLAAAPFLVAIIYLFLLLPLFSHDFWQVSSELGVVRVALLAIATVVPMLLLIFRNLLDKEELERIVERSADRLHPGRERHAEDIAGRTLREITDDRTPLDQVWNWRPGGNGAPPAESWERTQLSRAYNSPAFDYYIRYIFARLRRTFRWHIAVRLTLGAIGIALSFTAYIYVISWIGVSADQAREWSQRGHAATWAIRGLGISVPDGPHLWAAAVMGIAATTIFLALATTNDETQKAFARTFAEAPIAECLRFAIPMLELARRTDERERIETASGSHDVALFSTSTATENPGRVCVFFDWKAPSWEPPATTRYVTFSTTRSGCDTYLAAYVGSRVRAVPVAHSEAVEEHHNHLKFEAQADAQYVIALDGFMPGEVAAGKLFVDWGPPDNDDFASARVLSAATGSVRASNVAATAEEEEPEHAGAVGEASVWYRWRAPRSGRVVFETSGTSFDVLLAVYTGERLDALTEVAANRVGEDHVRGTRVQFDAERDIEYMIAIDGVFGATGDFVLSWGPPPNDDYAAAMTIARASGSLRGTNAGATREIGEPEHASAPGGASVWYRWTAPADGDVVFRTAESTFDTLLAVYTGSELAGLTEVASEASDPDSGTRPEVGFDAKQGAEYWIAVDGLDGTTGEFNLSWHLTAPPANDSFASGEELLDASGTVRGTNVGATKESGEPEHASNVGGGSVWYRYRAHSDGRMVVDTSGSNFDTLLAVYTGSSVESLTQVAANDDVPFSQQSRVEFAIRKGVEYLIAVDGFRFGLSDVFRPYRRDWRTRDLFRHARGDIVLNWVANDDFASRWSLEGPRGSVHGANVAATKEDGEPNHADREGGPSVWFSWRAPKDGEVVFDTAGSAFDTLLAVYIGTSVDSLLPVAANDDDEELGRQSRVRFDAVKGTEYAIAVDGFAGVTGEFALNWDYTSN